MISTAHASRILPALLAIVTCALILGLTVPPLSATRIESWPWAALAAFAWFLPVAVALYRFAQVYKHARFGGCLDAGFGLLVLTAGASAIASPVSGAILPRLLPVLGTCALPYALLPWLQPEHARATWRISGLVIITALGSGLFLWLQPWNGFHWPTDRNDQPFGHGNTTGSVAVLAATWLAAGATRERGFIRALFIFGVLLAVAIAVSSESRGAAIALAAAGATAAAIIMLNRGRRLLFFLLLVALAGGAIGANERMRDLVLQGRWSSPARESNDQRTAMLFGGLRLGVERPWLGWGAGAVPHVFPRERSDLPGTADNVLQLHNSPVQLWATLGGVGLLAGLLIVIGLTKRLWTADWTPERTALAAGLVGGCMVMLFDHPFATPIFAVLVAAHIAAWGSRAPDNSRPQTRLVAGLGTLLVVPVLFASGRDLAARQAADHALDQAERGNAHGYAASLRDAIAINPYDPYYKHQLAAWCATGHPFAYGVGESHEEAVALLRQTLVNNPDLEYAHYNLGWLLVTANPSESAAHFLRAAHLAPRRGEVYYGLGCARLNLGDKEGALRAFAAEWLLDPSFAWSPVWTVPPLNTLTGRVHALAASAVNNRGIDPWRDLGMPAATGPAYRRLRTGYGVLMGHPQGPPLIDFNIQQKIILQAGLRGRVPDFGWIDGSFLLNFIDRPTS